MINLYLCFGGWKRIIVMQKFPLMLNYITTIKSVKMIVIMGWADTGVAQSSLSVWTVADALNAVEDDSPLWKDQKLWTLWII